MNSQSDIMETGEAAEKIQHKMAEYHEKKIKDEILKNINSKKV